jgi:hypothetical protein
VVADARGGREERGLEQVRQDAGDAFEPGHPRGGGAGTCEQVLREHHDRGGGQ